MAITIQGSPWETYSDLNPVDADALDDYPTIGGPKINGNGTIGTMGHHCYYDLAGTTAEACTRPFDFNINGDFTIIVNTLSTGLAGATTADISVKGSVDGENYVDLKNNVVNDGDINGVMAVGVFDYDENGRMPYITIGIDQNSNRDETIMVTVIPHF